VPLWLFFKEFRIQVPEHLAVARDDPFPVDRVEGHPALPPVFEDAAVFQYFQML